MNDSIEAQGNQRLVIRTEHGKLYGQLTFSLHTLGLVILVNAAKSLDARDQMLASEFRHAGLATLTIDLVTEQEERFPDVHNNVPLLSRRLVDCLNLIRKEMQLEQLPHLPIGLYGANATTPVVLRVAALRDDDIAAIVCRGGLLDLAGVLYLHSLTSPLLMLVDETDSHEIKASQRALKEVKAAHVFKLIPETGADFSISNAFPIVANEASGWFTNHFKAD